MPVKNGCIMGTFESDSGEHPDDICSLSFHKIFTNLAEDVYSHYISSYIDNQHA